MLQFPNIDPVAISLGPLQIHWYGIAYLIGFLAVYWLGRYRAQKHAWQGFNPDEMSDLVFMGTLGVIIGGRLGYVFFYGLDQLQHDWHFIYQVWNGGMSFHGGFGMTILLLWWYARKTGRHFLQVTDFIVPLCALGIGLVRIANFINGELWGRVTDVSWGMVFPTGGPAARHPSQLYEAFAEGFLLFVVIWWFARVPRPLGAASALFALGYAIARFSIEFFRQPDVHMGDGGFLYDGWLTMGMVLTIPMMLAAITVLVLSYRGVFKRKGKAVKAYEKACRKAKIA